MEKKRGDLAAFRAEVSQRRKTKEVHGDSRGREGGQPVSSSLTPGEGDVTIRQEIRAASGHILKCCFLYNLNLQQTDTAGFISYIKMPLSATAEKEEEEEEEEKK